MCDREEKVSWDQVFNTKAEVDSISTTADKKEVKREEKETLKQGKAQLTKIPNVFKEERSLTKPRKEEGKELILNIKEREIKKTQISDKFHKCKHCFKSFSRKGGRKAHSLTCSVTGEAAHRCEKCGKYFSQEYSLKRHVENSCNEILKKCKSCEKVFRLNESFVQPENLNKCFECHKNAENSMNIKNRPFTCKTFNKSYKVRGHLSHHLLSHSDVKPHQCELFDKSFKLSHQLKNHLTTYSNEKPYTCEECGNNFSQKVHLRNHLMTHTGEKPYVCSYCKRSFTWEKSLNNHILAHTGKKPHQCKQCNKSFTLLHHLKRHLLIHSGKKPHQCARCDKAFTLKEQLKHHLTVAHNFPQGALANG